MFSQISELSLTSTFYLSTSAKFWWWFSWDPYFIAIRDYYLFYLFILIIYYLHLQFITICNTKCQCILLYILYIILTNKAVDTYHEHNLFRCCVLYLIRAECGLNTNCEAPVCKTYFITYNLSARPVEPGDNFYQETYYIPLRFCSMISGWIEFLSTCVSGCFLILLWLWVFS